MKQTILAILTAGTLLTGGCSKDFLQQDKPLVKNPADAFATAKDIKATLIGCYGNFKNTDTDVFMGGKMYVVSDNRGDDVVNQSNPATLQDTYEMTVNSATIENTNFWKMAYLSINTSNLFIDGMAQYNCKEVLGEELYDQYIAEAKFLRAYTYYTLCQLYSKPYTLDPDAKAVPLRLKGLTSSGNNACRRSTISEVYAAILEDLLPDALPNAPQTYDGVTRASKAAAYTLQMRVYMAMNEWDKAITAGELISGYDLAQDVSSLYGVNTYNNPEIIFALPMSSVDTPNTQMSVSEYFSPSAKVCWLDTDAGILSMSGYNSEKDQRISKLVTVSGAHTFSLKFTSSTKLDWVPQIRYAETLLNLAECYANQADGAAQARAYLKRVRSRSLAAADDTINVDALSGNDLKNAIYKERRLELICEGIRGADIMRRGESFVKGNANTVFSKTVTPSDSYYTWPIPQTEIAFNPDINK